MSGSKYQVGGCCKEDSCAGFGKKCDKNDESEDCDNYHAGACNEDNSCDDCCSVSDQCKQTAKSSYSKEQLEKKFEKLQKLKASNEGLEKCLQGRQC